MDTELQWGVDNPLDRELLAYYVLIGNILLQETENTGPGKCRTWKMIDQIAKLESAQMHTTDVV